MAHQENKKLKYLFFDMDGTLTRSKSRISPEMIAALKNLPLEIFVISGAVYEQMRFQIGDDFWLLPQSGNEVYRPGGELLRTHVMPEALREVAVSYGQQLLADCSVIDTGDCIQTRGAQVSVSLYGHNSPLAEKERFDPDRTKRAALVRNRPLVSEHLYAVIGGTTCVDIFERGRTKGDNVRRLVDELGLTAEEGMYVGDALFPGGNDESVIGVLETFSVRDPLDTLSFLSQIPRV